ncbi:FUSC family protein [Streptomyces sp. TLI_105]|uniref:FUSC family protein n=1 Tax=Streptomyces sp. TLI_105 TaxID=1881019 RepID=UPI0008970A6D|nr:FUSC family protein [Streptomyces sp. TLI_105]SEB64352.1 Fusaric acid resistance protein-like [Streptomyces sp. TLI_105]
MGGAFPRRPSPAYRAAARRALRVTIAATAGFYVLLHGFDSAVGATYALFGAIAMAGLSHLPGSGRQRAVLLVDVVPVCWVLITLGTYLSVRTWSAVVGMLVVGFVLAFMAVGGPRFAGAATGLQLMYILPSFPPYDPGSLGERLAGATFGLVLLTLAEMTLLPEPAALPYRERAARAADGAARCADRLRSAPYTLPDAMLHTARALSTGLRSSQVPEAERPAGAGVRPRALAHTGLATRTLLGRLTSLPPPPPATAPPREAEAGTEAGTGAEAWTAGGAGAERGAQAGSTGQEARTRAAEVSGARLPDPLRAVAGVARETAARLRGGMPDGRAHARLRQIRQTLTAAEDGSPAVLRRDAALLELVNVALAMSTAADIAVRGRAADTPEPGPFWYARMRAPRLWWRRLSGHVGSRSVFFQNAVRISLALAAARLIAGIDTLPHGFWVLLATLTLTRTTVRETRKTERIALTGTLVGALVAAASLALVGTDIEVYAVALPPLMLVTFTLGPVKGVGWAQALFTVVVALVFAQLAPATWQLAEFRLLDVLTGSAIGAVFGLLAWPRGAHDELRRSVAVLLRIAAEIVVATTAQIAAGGRRVPVVTAPGHRSLQHALVMAESAYAQYQSEPKGPTPPPVGQDWQAALIAGHHALWGADRLLVPPEPVVVPPLGREAAESAIRTGDRVAADMLLTSARIDPTGDTVETPVPLHAPTASATTIAADPPGAPRLYYATVSWLASLTTDLVRLAGGTGTGAGAGTGADAPVGKRRSHRAGGPGAAPTAGCHDEVDRRNRP